MKYFYKPLCTKGNQSVRGFSRREMSFAPNKHRVQEKTPSQKAIALLAK